MPTTRSANDPCPGQAKRSRRGRPDACVQHERIAGLQTKGMTMSTPQGEGLNPAEQALFAAAFERLRQLRLRSGVPDGVRLQEAVDLHMISAEQVELARWGPLAPALAPSAEAPARGEQKQ
jgi:hypothetical protein